MSNFVQVKREIINYVYARTPLIIVNTNERERVERILNEIADEVQAGFLYYTDAKQVRYIGAKGEGWIRMMTR